MQKSILLIDEDEDEHHFLREAILETGIFIYSAHDGPCGLRLLEQLNDNLPSLIILELNMRKMSGLEVLVKIKSKYRVPVLIHSIAFADSVVQTAKNLGALDCVKKGNSYAEIQKTIHRFLMCVDR